MLPPDPHHNPRLHVGTCRISRNFTAHMSNMVPHQLVPPLIQAGLWVGSPPYGGGGWRGQKNIVVQTTLHSNVPKSFKPRNPRSDGLAAIKLTTHPECHATVAHLKHPPGAACSRPSDGCSIFTVLVGGQRDLGNHPNPEEFPPAGTANFEEREKYSGAHFSPPPPKTKKNDHPKSPNRRLPMFQQRRCLRAP